MTPTEKALLTWYEPDNPKYKDPLHPTIKLAGETGELLELYTLMLAAKTGVVLDMHAKHLFKPDFDWTDCKHCNLQHRSSAGVYSHNYVPKVLDELGDIWYYLRILAWINEIELEDFVAYSKSELSIIKAMHDWGNILLQNPVNDETWEALQMIYEHLLLLLEKLGYTIDQLTELNYQKLNSEETNHGWKEAK